MFLRMQSLPAIRREFLGFWTKNSRGHTVNNSGAIPFLDLVALHASLEEELYSVLKQSLLTAGFIGGPMVEGFEIEFAKFCETRHCIGVCSGTDALRFALMAVGIEPGAIVVTVP